MLFLGACRSEFLCHLAECKAKLNVALELSCVKSVLLAAARCIELEKSEFNRAFGEGCVEVEHMVAALVVVVASAVIRSVAFVPDVRKLAHGLRLFAVQFCKEIRIDCSAVAVHSALVYFQGCCDQLFVACHQVCEVSECLCRVSFCSDVNVYSAAPCCIAFRSCLAKFSDEFLQGFDVAVGEDRGYQSYALT